MWLISEFYTEGKTASVTYISCYSFLFCNNEALWHWPLLWILYSHCFFCSWDRNSKKLRMKSIEWELKIAASFFPNTLQTLSKQVAPTVKPSVLQAIKENENKKIPKWALSFFFVLFNTFLLFFPFLGHSEFLENITAELSSPKSDCYQNSFFVSLCTRTHTHTSWTGLCFAVWQAEI